MGTTTEARKEPPWAPPPVLFMGSSLQSRFSRRFSRPSKRKGEDDALDSPEAKRCAASVPGPDAAAGTTISIQGSKNEPGASERVVFGDVKQSQGSSENAVEQGEVSVSSLNEHPEVQASLNMVVDQQGSQTSCSTLMALRGEAELELVELQAEVPVSMGQDPSSSDQPALSRVVLDQEHGRASSSSLNEVQSNVVLLVDDELEEGELPESQDLSQLQMEEGEWPGEARESCEPDRQAENGFKMPEEGLRKQELPTLSLLSAAALIDGTPSQEPEFSLADWHAHITSGKPLVAVQQTTQVKKNKKRRNRRAKNTDKAEQQAAATQHGRTVVFSRPVQRDPLAEAAKEALGKKVQVRVQSPRFQAQARCQVPPQVPPQVQGPRVQAQARCQAQPQFPPQVQSQLPFQVQSQAHQAHPEAQFQAVQAHPQAPSPTFQFRPQETIEEPKVKNSNEARPADESLTALVEKFLGIEHEEEKEETGKRSHKRRLTAERKEKKRALDKQKRAEKSRQLGVQRRRPVFVKPEPRPPPVCKYFLKGRCTKGTECGFSHDATPVMKSELCKYFLTNCCLKGDDCPFSHETSKFPCKYFVTTGRCKYRDGCRFAHRAVTEEEMVKVLKRLKKKTTEAETATGIAREDGQEQEQVDGDGQEQEQVHGDGQEQEQADDGEEDRDGENHQEQDGEENRDEPDDDNEGGDRDESEYDPVFPGSSWWKDSEDAAATAAAAADEYDPIPAASWWKMVAETEKRHEPCSKADSGPGPSWWEEKADKQTAVECGQTKKSAMEYLLEQMDGLV